jgi:hypothetical protein
MPPKDKKLGSKPVDDDEAVKATLIVKDGDKEYRLHTDDFGPADTMACRQQTGLPVEHYMTNIGLDSMIVIIWVARRNSGEPNLAFQKVLSKYGTTEAVNALEFEIEYDDDEEPEAGKEKKDKDGPLVDAD